MENNDYITLLSSILSRVNLVGACLPDYLQEDIDEIKLDINSVLRENNCNVNLSNIPSGFSLNMVSLYKILSTVYKDLNTCMEITSDEALEEAASSVNYIIINMSHIDSVFGACYETAKKKVLK